MKMTLAERLSTARKEAGLSQSALAKLVHTGQSTIGSIECGRNTGSTLIPLIANALGVSALWLAEGKGEKQPTLTADTEEHSHMAYAKEPTQNANYSNVLPIPAWPFKRIPITRFSDLPADEQAFIEGQLLSMIKDAENRLGKPEAAAEG